MEVSMRVLLRVRPLSKAERAQKDKEAVICHPGSNVAKLLISVEGGRRMETQEFTFDHVFHSASTQEEVFEHAGVKDLILSMLEGYSSTLFAYGQTGSGKTYTMTGEAEQQAGITPRAVKWVFDELERHQRSHPTLKYTLKASYLEIYNEQVNDMLDPESVNLNVRWSSTQQGFFVENLMVVQCDVLEDMTACLDEGMSNRKKAAHDLNKDSSRSHAIFTIYCDVSPEGTDADPASTASRFGKLHLVDLAGSERLKDSKSANDAATETAHINKSLLVLGQVIAVLAGDSKKGQHVPYRDSKLTKLLMDSLGGMTRTTLIATVAPGQRFSDETSNTIKFAMRARNVKSKPAVRLDAQQQVSLGLQMEIEALRLENAFLWQQLPAPADSQQLAALRKQQEVLRQVNNGVGQGDAITKASDMALMVHNLQEEVSRLQGENQLLTQKLQGMQALADENERLKKELSQQRSSSAKAALSPKLTAAPIQPLQSGPPLGVLKLMKAAGPVRINLAAAAAPPLRSLLSNVPDRPPSAVNSVSTIDMEELHSRPSDCDFGESRGVMQAFMPELDGPHTPSSDAGAQPSMSTSPIVKELEEERLKLLRALKYTDAAMDTLQKDNSRLGTELHDLQQRHEQLQTEVQQLQADNANLTAALEGDSHAAVVNKRLRYLEERNAYLSRLLCENGFQLEL